MNQDHLRKTNKIKKKKKERKKVRIIESIKFLLARANQVTTND